MKITALAGLALLLVPAAALAQTGPAAASLPNSFDQTAPAPAAGDIDTANLSDDLVAAITAQADQVTPLIRSFGAVQAVTFVGKRDGADLFSVLFTNAETEWMIGFNDDGRIGVLLFRPAPTQ